MHTQHITTLSRGRLRALCAVLALFLATMTASAIDALTDNCSVTINGRVARVNRDGTFTVFNLPITGGLVRAHIICYDDDGNIVRYARSEFFVVKEGEDISVGDIEYSDTPFLAVEAISIAPVPDLTAIDATAQLVVTATLSDATEVNVSAKATATIYFSSNPNIVSISEDGLATAVSTGTVIISASNDGNFAAAKVNFVLPDKSTQVDGIVRDGDGAALSGIRVNVSNSNFSTTTGDDGSFRIANVTVGAATETIDLVVWNGWDADLPTQLLVAAVPFENGGVTDAGLIMFIASADVPPDGDEDGVSDVQELIIGTDPANPNTNGTGPNDGGEDPDGDNVTTTDEINTYGSDPLLANSDGDALNDGEEVALGTDPTKTDTDNDGLDDFVEVNTYFTSATDSDTDNDGLLDGEEVNTYTTDPLIADVDGDGVPDGNEILLGLIHNDADSDDNGTDDGQEDGDGDTVDNATESTNGTDPTDPDSDNDGLNDGIELALGLNPLLVDTDTNGTDDGDEDSDDDGLTNLFEIEGSLTQPQNPDTDADGIDDGDEINISKTDPLKADTDGDGLNDGDEFNIHETHPGLADTDGDGLDDGDEVNTHNTLPLYPDTDGDGLNDGDEINTHNTDPLIADTDGDGINDGDEIANGTDPNNALPSIQSLVGTPLALLVNQQATITVTATDSDSPAIAFTWTATGGVITGTSNQVTWTAPAVAGTYTVTVDVTDSVDTVSASLSFAVSDDALTNLKITVVQDDDLVTPVAGIRVILHDGTGAIDEEIVTLANGIANFGAITGNRATFTLLFHDAEGDGEWIAFTIVNSLTGDLIIPFGEDEFDADVNLEIRTVPADTVQIQFENPVDHGSLFQDVNNPVKTDNDTKWTYNGARLEDDEGDVSDSDTITIVATALKADPDNGPGIPQKFGFTTDLDIANLPNPIVIDLNQDPINLPFTSDRTIGLAALNLIRDGANIRLGTYSDNNNPIDEGTILHTDIAHGVDDFYFHEGEYFDGEGGWGIETKKLGDTIPAALAFSVPAFAITSLAPLTTGDLLTGVTWETSGSTAGVDTAFVEIFGIAAADGDEFVWFIMFTPTATTLTLPALPVEVGGIKEAPPDPNNQGNAEFLLVSLDDYSGVTGFDDYLTKIQALYAQGKGGEFWTSFLLGDRVLSFEKDYNRVSLEGAVGYSGDLGGGHNVLVGIFDTAAPSDLTNPTASNGWTLITDLPGNFSFSLYPGTYYPVFVYDLNDNGLPDPLEPFLFNDNSGSNTIGPVQLNVGVFSFLNYQDIDDTHRLNGLDGGIVNYVGNQNGGNVDDDHPIVIELYRDVNLTDLFSRIEYGNQGSNLTKITYKDTYYIRGWYDANGNGFLDPGEPYTHFDDNVNNPTPVVVDGVVNVGLNIDDDNLFPGGYFIETFSDDIDVGAMPAFTAPITGIDSFGTFEQPDVGTPADSDDQRASWNNGGADAGVIVLENGNQFARLSTTFGPTDANTSIGILDVPGEDAGDPAGDFTELDGQSIIDAVATIDVRLPANLGYSVFVRFRFVDSNPAGTETLFVSDLIPLQADGDWFFALHDVESDNLNPEDGGEDVFSGSATEMDVEFFAGPGASATTLQIDVDNVQLALRYAVENNRISSVTSFTASAPQTAGGGQITLNLSASDPNEDNVLRYYWSATGGTITGAGAQQATWTAPAGEGVYIVSVLVFDGDEAIEVGIALTVTGTPAGPDNLKLTIVDAYGDTIAGATVLLHNPDGSIKVEKTSDANGVADFGNIGASHATFTALREQVEIDEDEEERWNEITTVFHSPTGNHTVPLGFGDEDEVSTDLVITNVPENTDRFDIFPQSHAFNEPGINGDTWTYSDLDIEYEDIEQLADDGTFNIVVTARKPDPDNPNGPDIPIGYGIKIDVLPATIDGGQVNISADLDMKEVAFTTNETLNDLFLIAVRNGGTTNLGSAFGTVTSPLLSPDLPNNEMGANDFYFIEAEQNTDFFSTRSVNMKLTNVFPNNVAITIPDFALTPIQAVTAGGNLTGMLWGVSGEAEDTDVTILELEGEMPDEKEIDWVITLPAGVTVFTFPSLPVAIGPLPESVLHSDFGSPLFVDIIDFVDVDGFEDYLGDLQNQLTNKTMADLEFAFPFGNVENISFAQIVRFELAVSAGWPRFAINLGTLTGELPGEPPTTDFARLQFNVSGTSEYPADSDVRFTGPEGSGLADSATDQAYDFGSSRQFISPEFDAFPPPAGTYTVDYDGTDYEFDVADLTDRQVIPVPTVTLVDGNLTRIDWTWKNPDGTDAGGVPAFVDKMDFQVQTVDSQYLNSEDIADPTNTFHVLSNPVTWTNVSEFSLNFTDAQENNFRSLWGKPEDRMFFSIFWPFDTYRIDDANKVGLLPAAPLNALSYNANFEFSNGIDNPETVTFTGPAESELQNSVSVNSFSFGNTQNYSRSVNAFPLPGDYTVRYKTDDYDYTFADLSLQLAVPLPSFTVDGDGELTRIDWAWKDLDGNGIGTPGYVDRVSLSVNMEDNGNGSFGQTDDGATTFVTFDSNEASLFENVKSVNITYYDNQDNSFQTTWNRVEFLLGLNHIVNAGTFGASATPPVAFPVAYNDSYEANLFVDNVPGALALANEVLFTGPAGSGFNNSQATVISDLGGGSAIYSLPAVEDPKFAPNGVWTVSYDGDVRTFDSAEYTAFDAGAKLFIPVPTVTLTDDILTSISWVWKNADGSNVGDVPALVNLLEVEVSDQNGVIYTASNLTPATLNHVLSQNVSWSATTNVRIRYSDSDGNNWFIDFNH